MTITVHRTEHPGPLTAYTAASTQHAAWRRMVTQWADRRGMPEQLRFRPGGMVLGVAYPADQPIPQGWRTSKQPAQDGTVIIVPFLRSEQGRTLASELGGLHRPPDVRTKLPGIAASCEVGGRIASFRLELRERHRGGALYAVWDTEVPPSVIRTPGMWRAVDIAAYARVVAAENNPGRRPAARPPLRKVDAL